MPLQSLDIVRRSATTTPSPDARGSYTGTVAKLIDTTKCIGCKACQVACMEWNDLRDEHRHQRRQLPEPRMISRTNPGRSCALRSTRIPKGDLEWLIRKDGCMHCEDPGCLKACPSPGAIVQYANGIVDFQEENCIGCGYCVSGCPFDIPRISKRDHKAYKCTLCSDRVAVGLEPACIKACPTGALVFGTKEDMQHHAAERVEDLKSRGFEHAGLYDPPGVGRHARHVRAASRRSAGALQRPGCRTRTSVPFGQPVEGPQQAAAPCGSWRSPRSPGFSTSSASGATRSARPTRRPRARFDAAGTPPAPAAAKPAQEPRP